MKNYRELIRKVYDWGQIADSRAGETFSTFGETIEFDLRDGFPIVTGRQIAYKQAFGELAAFISGATTNSAFEALGCRYWREYGEELGPIYGAQWRNFAGVDQLAQLLEGLKTEPRSRRHLLTTWNPQDLNKMALPPCHILAQFYVSTEDQLDCIVYMRSVDLLVGLPYDIVVYALLQHLIARQLGLAVRRLKFFLGDTHIYRNHRVNMAKYLELPCYPLPWLQLSPEASTNVLDFHPDQAELINYQHGPLVPFELNL